MPLLTSGWPAASIAVAVAGCFFSPNLDGKVRCGPGSECPPDLVCASDGFCRHSVGGNDGSVDGSVDGCADTWTTVLPPNVLPRGLALDPAGLLYLVGRESDKGWVNTFETCAGRAGATPTSRTVPGFLTGLSAVTLLADGAFVVGDVKPVPGDGPAADSGNGVYARLARGTLVEQWAQAPVGSANVDEIFAIAAGANDLWLTGVANGQVWVLKGSPAGNTCGFTAASAGGGTGRAALKNGPDIFVGGTRDGQGLLLRYSDSACVSSPPCGTCAPAFSSPPIIEGTQATDIHALVVVGGQLYAAGVGWDMTSPNDWFGFVLRFDSAGAVIARYRWNPTTQRDVLLGLASDGQQIYAAGLQGWNGDTAGTGAVASLIVLPPSLSVSGSPPGQSVSDLVTFWSVVADGGPGGAIYAAASSGVPETGGKVLKLRKNP